MSKKETTETSNLPVNLEDQIKKEIQAQKSQLGALPSNKISTRNKEFTLPDGRKGAELSVVILDFVWAMVNYPGVYNSNNPQQPNCFAISRINPSDDSRECKPHEDAADPQHSDCKDCPKNQWKSAHAGNGKACKNQRRLLVLPPDAQEGDEPMTLYVSPGGLKHFDAYISRLSNEHQMLPVQVITRMTFDQDQTYPLLKFELAGPHDNMNLFWRKREQAQEMLFRSIDSNKEKAA